MVERLNKEALDCAMKSVNNNTSLSEVHTNYFNKKLSAEITSVFFFKDGLIFIDKSNDELVGRMFYYFSRIDRLDSIDFNFNYDIVCDILTINPMTGAMIRFLNKLGFKKYSKLNKMVMNGRVNVDRFNVFNIVPAKTEDSKILLKIFKNDFDKYSERPPSKNAIKTAIYDKRIYKKINNKNDFLGFYWSEDKPFSTELRYLYVVQDHRRKGIGRELMNYYIYNCSKIKNKKLWVFDDNLEAIKLYSDLGYSFANLADYIFIKRKRDFD
jgi:GNAT superfamily N-acetyltransferase